MNMDTDNCLHLEVKYLSAMSVVLYYKRKFDGHFNSHSWEYFTLIRDNMLHLMVQYFSAVSGKPIHSRIT